MEQSQSSETTRLLRAWANGDPAALEELTPHVYRELRRIAGHFMQNEQAGRTVQATALVHEAYLKLVDVSNISWEHRTHFFAVAAQVMRRILLDQARRRLASDLHDDALQKLTAAELHLERIDGGGGGQNAALLEAVRPLLSQTEESLRRLLFEVRPPALEIPGGFEETIRDRVAMMRSLTGINAELDLELPDELSYEFKSMVFRQVAESLTNIEKHAAATRVHLSVKAVDGAIHGLVIDNGRGFVVSERDRLPGHLGLLALNERSVLAGGWTKIESEPGLGTKIEFWMPIA